MFSEISETIHHITSHLLDSVILLHHGLLEGLNLPPEDRQLPTGSYRILGYHWLLASISYWPGQNRLFLLLFYGRACIPATGAMLADTGVPTVEQ